MSTLLPTAQGWTVNTHLVFQRLVLLKGADRKHASICGSYSLSFNDSPLSLLQSRTGEPPACDCIKANKIVWSGLGACRPYLELDSRLILKLVILRSLRMMIEISRWLWTAKTPAPEGWGVSGFMWLCSRKDVMDTEMWLSYGFHVLLLPLASWGWSALRQPGRGPGTAACSFPTLGKCTDSTF